MFAEQTITGRRWQLVMTAERFKIQILDLMRDNLTMFLAKSLCKL